MVYEGHHVSLFRALPVQLYMADQLVILSSQVRDGPQPTIIPLTITHTRRPYFTL